MVGPRSEVLVNSVAGSTVSTYCRRLGFNPNRKGKIACWLTCDGPMPQPHNELCIQLWLRHQDPAKNLVFGMLALSAQLYVCTWFEAFLYCIADKEVAEWFCHRAYGAFQWAPHTSLTDPESAFIIENHHYTGLMLLRKLCLLHHVLDLSFAIPLAAHSYTTRL